MNVESFESKSSLSAEYLEDVVSIKNEMKRKEEFIWEFRERNSNENMTCGGESYCLDTHDWSP